MLSALGAGTEIKKEVVLSKRQRQGAGKTQSGLSAVRALAQPEWTVLRHQRDLLRTAG